MAKLTSKTPKTRSKKILPKSSLSKRPKASSKTSQLPVTYGYPNLPQTDRALTHYLKQISHYPILSEEEERTLVESFRQHKNVEAAKELIQGNLRLVVKIATEYSHAYQHLMDLIQEGNLGLMKAVQNYDPSKGARLGYYASWWIRSYILKYIMDNFRLVKVGTTQAQKKLFFNLVRERRKIEAMGIEGPQRRKLLADKFDVTEAQIDEMSSRLAHSEPSLDAKIQTSSGDDSLYLIDMIEDKNPDQLDKLMAKERREQLVEKLKSFSQTLSKKERIILQKRLLAEIPKTLEELGEEFGVTKERVRQLQNRLIQKFKEELKEFADEFLIAES
jgi:RNA polymerase sigma-32 factor